MASPPARAAGCGQGCGAIASKRRLPVARPQEVVASEQPTRASQRPAHKGQPAMANPQRAIARGQPCRQQGRRCKGVRPLAGRLPAARGRRCQRRGGDDDVVKAKRPRASF
ncbi:hypothetical protein GW17_00048861 [Ensete ventricosum]|nr:hypothetical protein GW17_00048861 [Ensete ventricosum]